MKFSKQTAEFEASQRESRKRVLVRALSRGSARRLHQLPDNRQLSEAGLRQANLTRVLDLWSYRLFRNLPAQSQAFNRSCEYRDNYPPGFWTSELDSKVAKRCFYVPEAEIPKEHLCVIDKDHQVHDFQITCSSRFRLRKVFR
jgi:hypothetical protein